DERRNTWPARAPAGRWPAAAGSSPRHRCPGPAAAARAPPDRAPARRSRGRSALSHAPESPLARRSPGSRRFPAPMPCAPARPVFRSYGHAPRPTREAGHGCSRTPGPTERHSGGRKVRRRAADAWWRRSKLPGAGRAARGGAGPACSCPSPMDRKGRSDGRGVLSSQPPARKTSQSLHILNELPDSLQHTLDLDHVPADLDVAGLGPDRVDLAADLLDHELELTPGTLRVADDLVILQKVGP